MLKRCQKCAHVSEVPTPLPPDAECPACGAVYAKVDAALAAQAAMLQQARAERADADALLSPRLKLMLGALLAVGLFLGGYWVGAANTRAELHQIAAAAAQAIVSPRPAAVPADAAPPAVRAAPQAAEAPAGPPPQVRPAAAAPRMIATLKAKRYKPDRIDDKIEIEVEFLERHGKSVRAFDGVLVFSDLLDNEIMRAKVEINQRIQSLASITWEGELDYNQFMSAHHRLRGEPLENLRLKFEPGKILYEDGERVDLTP